MATNFSKELIVKPGKKVNLSKYDPDDTLGWDKDQEDEGQRRKGHGDLDNLQYLLYAERNGLC